MQRRDSGLTIPAGINYEDPEPEKPDRTWKCKVGHLRTGKNPFQLQFLVDGEPVMMTSPLCPVCFRTWLESRFGMKEIKSGLHAQDRPSIQAAPTRSWPRQRR